MVSREQPLNGGGGQHGPDGSNRQSTNGNKNYDFMQTGSEPLPPGVREFGANPDRAKGGQSDQFPEQTGLSFLERMQKFLTALSQDSPDGEQTVEATASLEDFSSTEQTAEATASLEDFSSTEQTAEATASLEDFSSTEQTAEAMTILEDFSSIEQIGEALVKVESTELSVASGTKLESNALASNSFSEAIGIYLKQAQIYCEQKQWEKAIGSCQEVLSISPDNVAALKTWGDVLQKSGHGADAMSYYAKALMIQPNYPEVHANLGALYAKRKEWDKALEYYEKAVLFNPYFAKAYRNLAKVYQKLGQQDEMNHCTIQALLLDPELGTVEELCRVGSDLMERNEEGSLRCFNAALKLDPDCMEAYQGLASLYDGQGNWQEAAVCYRKVLDLNETRLTNRSLASPAIGPDSKSQQKNSGHLRNGKRPISQSSGLENKNGLVREGASAVSRATGESDRPQLTNQNDTVYQLKAQTDEVEDRENLKQSDDFLAEEASTHVTYRGLIDKLVEAEQAQPESESIQVELGQLYLQQHEWQNAREHFRKALGLNPKSAVAYRNLAKVLSNLQKRNEAVECWFRAFCLEPKWASGNQHFSLGVILLKQGDLDKAEICFNTAIEFKPELEKKYTNIKNILKKKTGNQNSTLNSISTIGYPIKTDKIFNEDSKYIDIKSFEEFDDISSNEQNDGEQVSTDFVEKERAIYAAAMIVHQKAEKLQEKYKFQEAIIEYKQAIEIDPCFSWSHHNMGKCYQELGDWENAAVAYKDAIKFEPEEFVWSYYHLGEVLKRSGLLEDSLQSFKRVIEKDFRNEYAQLRTIEVLRSLLKTNPRKDELYIDLAECLISQEKVDEAISTYKMALLIHPDNPRIASELRKIKPKEDLQPIEIVRQSFDKDYYLAEYPDVIEAGIEPVEHYCNVWATETFRNPTPWFSTQYYLETNADVTELGINPFWHYLVAGRIEGRCPQKPGGYKRVILDQLLDVISNNEKASLPNTIQSLTKENLLDFIYQDVAKTNSIVLSVSHDCYIKVVGGIQIFISDEQQSFNNRNISYIHVSPYLPNLKLVEDSLEPFFIQIVLNGKLLGVTTYQDLCDILKGIRTDKFKTCIFTVHCVLGHKIAGLLSLQSSIKPEKSYFWLHDYSSLCVNYNLLRNNISYCGAPENSSLACRTCIHGEERQAHQGKIERLFNNIGFEVISPSNFTHNMWQAKSQLKFNSSQVKEHCQIELTEKKGYLKQYSHKGEVQNPIRVAYIGYPSLHKGWQLFLNLYFKTKGSSRYKFYHFAEERVLQDIMGIENIPVHVLPESRSSMVEALKKESIDIVLVLSVWPETFSYVTYESLAAGASIIALKDSGNVVDIVKSSNSGLVVNDENELVQCFLSEKILNHVQERMKLDVKAGNLINIGTTASM